MLKNLALLILISFTGSVSAFSHLDNVIQSKILNVCTTGDYLPYTLKKAEGSYQGIDVSMAQSLASSLGAKVNWRPVSWKTLMNDFEAQKCYIEMGGHLRYPQTSAPGLVCRASQYRRQDPAGALCR